MLAILASLIRKIAAVLAKNILLPSVLSASASAGDIEIQRVIHGWRVVRVGKGMTLVISDENMGAQLE